MAKWYWAQDLWLDGCMRLPSGRFVLIAQNERKNRTIWVVFDEKEVRKLIKKLNEFLEIREASMTRRTAEYLDKMFRKIEGDVNV